MGPRPPNSTSRNASKTTPGCPSVSPATGPHRGNRPTRPDDLAVLGQLDRGTNHRDVDEGAGRHPADSSRGERLLEGEGREQFGAVCGEKDLLLELDTLPAGWLADVAFDTDRHVLRERAVVAEGVEIGLVVQIRVLPGHAAPVCRQEVAVVGKPVGDLPGGPGVVPERQPWAEQCDVVLDLFPGDPVQLSLLRRRRHPADVERTGEVRVVAVAA